MAPALGRHRRRRSPYADEDLRFLRLFKVIGGGGCAIVYAGLLHGLEVKRRRRVRWR